MKKLTHREIRLLSTLADGCTYKEVCAYFGMSLANVHTTCHAIRKKTGILQTRDQKECQRYFSLLDPREVKRALDMTPAETKPLTYCQMDAFRLLALGRSYSEIATTLGIQPQSVQNLITRGCKRLGITHHGWDRTERIKKWLKRYDRPAGQDDPMDDPAF